MMASPVRCTPRIHRVDPILYESSPVYLVHAMTQELDGLPRQDLVELVLQLQRGEGREDACPAEGCDDDQVDAPTSSADGQTRIVAGGGPNDQFDEYDGVYPGLWVADADAEQEFFTLGPQSQPSANKRRLQAEHTAIWAAARKTESDMTAEEQVS
jgi:hypothetical protein